MPLKPVIRMLVFTISVAANLTAIAQVHSPDNRPRNCSISGRVVIGGNPAANAQVIVSEIPASRAVRSSVSLTQDNPLARTVYKARTDADGRYQVTDLPAGRYGVDVLSRAYVSAEKDADAGWGKAVTLDDGEAHDKVDFALLRGSVITGRVTDSEGHPVIASPVYLFSIEKTGPMRVNGTGRGGWVKTDDRGVYRAYGLRAGHYLVSVNGEEHRDDNGTPHRITFHPNITDQKQAKVIEVKTGEEATGIDIRLAAGGPRYEASGRVVDAETEKPLPNIIVSCDKIRMANPGEEENASDESQADADGNFRCSGLIPGRYHVAIGGAVGSEIGHYFEGDAFEINDASISGLIIKAVPGGVISGVAVIEGMADPISKAKLSQARIAVFVESESQGFYGGAGKQLQINADGTFRLTGLAPGILHLNLFGMPDSSPQFLRIERGGSEIKGDIVIGKGEKISDLRLVFGRGSGVIRGQVQITSGQLPEGWQLGVQAHRLNATAADSFNPSPNAIADKRGQFVIEKLFPGEYELVFSTVFIGNGSTYSSTMPEPRPKVTVANNAEAQITVSLDLSQIGKEKK